MDRTEKTLDSTPIFQGRIIKVRVDRVSLPDGRESTREVVEHAPAVAIVAMDEHNELILVSQYRKPAEQLMLEIPAGIMEAGESPLEAAKRELAEETGYRGSRWKKISSFYTSPGFSDEKIHLFFASQLTSGQTQFDEDEFIELQRVSLPQALEWITEGKIVDAKTIIGIQAAALIK